MLYIVWWTQFDGHFVFFFHLQASTDYDGQSVSSGSIVSNIDWEEVDRILDS